MPATCSPSRRASCRRSIRRSTRPPAARPSASGSPASPSAATTSGSPTTRRSPTSLAAAPAAATRALGLPGGPLLGLRLVNVAAACAAVALSYLLGRDLAGGDPHVGLVAAGLVAAAPHLGFVAVAGLQRRLRPARHHRACSPGWPAPAVPDRRAGATAAVGRRCWALAARSPPLPGRWRWCSPWPPVLVALAVAWWRRSAPLWWSLGWLAVPTRGDRRLVLRAQRRPLRRPHRLRRPVREVRPGAGRVALVVADHQGGLGVGLPHDRDQAPRGAPPRRSVRLVPGGRW